MPATSKAQQKFMGMVHSAQKGEKPASAKVAKVAKSMKKKDAEDYASTKHKGLPKKVKEALLSENPAASAAAAMVMMQMQNPDTGRKIKAITPLKDKDHKLHGKAKGIFQRLKDKFKKGKGKKDFEKQKKAISKGADDYIRKLDKESVKEERDYKAEYKKYGSSTKAKKYRAELNQYNRKRGTYGNGDGKDASHKGGKIAGFEAESTNRGRAEKSRLKKEDITMLEAKFNDDTLSSRIKHWGKQHKGTGIGYGHVLGQLAVHMKEMGWNKSYKEVARIAVELGKKKKVESVNEGIDDKMKKIMTKLAKSLGIKSVVNMYTGKGSLSYMLDDDREAKKLQKFLQRSFKRVRLIPLDKSRGDEANWVVAADMLGLESVNEGKKSKKVAYNIFGALRTTINQTKILRKMIDDAPYNKLYGMISGELYKFEIDLEKKLRMFQSPLKKLAQDKMLESVNEVSGVDVAKKVLKNKQMEKGIDLQTANLIVTIDKAYNKNPELQKKFRKIQLPKMKQLIMKYYG